MQKLGLNHGGYRGERIDIAFVLDETRRVATERGWKTEKFGKVGSFDLIALHRRPTKSSNSSHRIYISTGIHGDEPAGPLAALRLLHDDAWPHDAEIVLLPCLNPVGFKNNTRENGLGIDLNRDYLDPKSPEIRAHVAWLEKQQSFDVCFCLHEDWESHGFYLYELNPENKPSLADQMLAAAKKVCPIDLSPIIEKREARGGIIRPSLDPQARPLWPESFWLLQNRTRLSYTLEASSDFELQLRVNALIAATNAAMVSSKSSTPHQETPSGNKFDSHLRET